MKSKVVLALFSVVIAIAMVEGTLRWRHIAEPRWAFYYPRYYLSDHPVLGFCPTPARVFHVRKLTLANNADGYRDVDHSSMPSPQTYRVLGIGDSQTWGANINVEGVYLKQMEDIVNRTAGARVEVILGGVPGYASDQAVGRLRLDGEKLRPRLVVLGLFLDYEYGELPRLLAHQKFGVERVYDGYVVPSRVVGSPGTELEFAL